MVLMSMWFPNLMLKFIQLLQGDTYCYLDCTVKTGSTTYPMLINTDQSHNARKRKEVVLSRVYVETTKVKMSPNKLGTLAKDTLKKRVPMQVNFYGY